MHVIMTLADFFGWDEWWVVGLAAFEMGAIGLVLTAMLWFVGRDRWRGDAAFPSGPDRIRPLQAPQTIVPEFAPPDVPDLGRPLRPAEMGFLVNERTDITELAATILDLAARGHIDLSATTSIDGQPDFLMSENATSDDDLETFEALLLNWLFQGEIAEVSRDGMNRTSVLLSQLEGVFGVRAEAFSDEVRAVVRHNGLTVSNSSLLASMVHPNAPFRGVPTDFDHVRRLITTFAPLVTVALGARYGHGLLGVPLFFAAAALWLMKPTLGARTGLGSEMRRRSLGFRLFLSTALADQLRDLDANAVTHRYMAYAMVLGVADEWEKRFKGLESFTRMPAWYDERRTGEKLRKTAKSQTPVDAVAGDQASR